MDMQANEEVKTPFQASIYYGVLLAVISIIFNLFSVFIPSEQRQSNALLFGLLSFIIIVGSITYVVSTALNARKKEQGGFISFGQGITMSFWIGLVNSLIYSVWSLVLYIIDPNALENAINEVRMQLEKRDDTEEQIAMQMKIMEYAISPYITLPIGVIFSVLITMIIGLAISGILQKEKEHPF